MINTEVRNCLGISVPMVSSDVEEEVSTFEGILSYFHMSFKMKKNKYTARKRECFCTSCQKGDFKVCSNKIPVPVQQNPNVLGMRQPKGREVIINAVGLNKETEEYVVEKILGKRTHKVYISKKEKKNTTINSSYFT